MAHDPRGMPLDPRQEAPLVGGGAREVGHRPAIRDLGAVQVARPRVAAEVDVDDRLAQRAEQRQLAQREEAVRRAEDERVVADECRGEEHHHRRPIQEPPRRAREAARRDGPPVQPRHDACQPTLIGRRCIATRVVPQVDERRPDADLLESGAQVAAVAGYLAKADEHRVRAPAHSASSPRLPPSGGASAPAGSQAQHLPRTRVMPRCDIARVDDEIRPLEHRIPVDLGVRGDDDHCNRAPQARASARGLLTSGSSLPLLRGVGRTRAAAGRDRSPAPRGSGGRR